MSYKEGNKWNRMHIKSVMGGGGGNSEECGKGCIYEEWRGVGMAQRIMQK